MVVNRKTFADYKDDAPNWITLASGEYYPDILENAKDLYKPVLVMFGQLLKASESSARLLLLISEIPDGWMRIQLLRVFRKYVSPDLPVEMLKKKRKAPQIVEQYDSDRGGAQEDDRTSGYHNTARELLNYAAHAGLAYKVIFLNDGPGLLLGSMWDDYAYLEQSWPGKVLVTTLRMVPERLTSEWLKAKG